MWIKSQNGMKLVNVTVLKITPYADGKACIDGMNEAGDFRLALYSTKERAAKELDQIVFTMMNRPAKDFVWQMTEDQEV